jgi:hypothetical protein
MHGVGFVELEYGDISVEFAVPVDCAEECCCDAARKVATGAVGKYRETLTFEQLDNHFCCRRLAVGSTDEHDAAGKLLERTSGEMRIDFFDKKSRERRASAASLGKLANGLADECRKRLLHTNYYTAFAGGNV